MMELLNFQTKKKIEERGYSVEQVIQDAEELKNETDNIVILMVDRGGLARCSYSTDNLAELVGLLDVTKSIILDDI